MIQTMNEDYKPIDHTKEVCGDTNRPTPPDMRVPAEVKDKRMDFILSDKTIWFTLSVTSHNAMMEALELFKDFDLNVSVEHDINSYEIVVRKPEWDDYD